MYRVRMTQAAQRKIGRLALFPLLGAALVVAAPTSPAAAPNAQGLSASGGAVVGSPAPISDLIPRQATHDTGRKTG